jgi:imidazolonepropionase-like amidohydrolase
MRNNCAAESVCCGYAKPIRLAASPRFVLLASGTSRATDLALIGAKVYPSPTDPPFENGSILIRDGHILAVGPSQTIKIPRAATVIDCKGLVVTAGFWNSHVHILTPALLHVHNSSVKHLDEQLDTMFNRSGFTTVFDISSVLDNTLALRARIESNELRGPRILTVGEPIWTIEPVYVHDFLEENHVHIANTAAPDQAIALVRDHAAKGANGIKLFAGSYTTRVRGKLHSCPWPLPRPRLRRRIGTACRSSYIRRMWMV